VIRALVYYPLNAGRNVDEIYRLVIALQTTDRHACATPANWKEGEKVVVPPPKTVEELEKHLSNQDLEHKDFYLSMKDLTGKKDETPKSA
jgi:peroxiredoxin 2/4